MADKEEKKAEENKEVKVVKNAPPWPLITIGIFATVVTLALIIVSWLLIASHYQERTTRLGNFDRDNRGQLFHRGGGMRDGGVFKAVAAHGVITAINGDTITVSGGGKQIAVKKTSSTTINGDKTTLAVNDTIIVIGETASDGTVTASRIVIRNVGIESVERERSPDTDTLPGA